MGAASSVVLGKQDDEPRGFVLDETLATYISCSSEQVTIDHVNAIVVFMTHLFPLTRDWTVNTGIAADALEVKLREFLIQKQSSEIASCTDSNSESPPLSDIDSLAVWAEIWTELLETDPWRDLALADQLRRLQDEELQCIDLAEGDDLHDTVSAL
jgi:hypothetical protein